jgi:hypothetical protein
MKAQLTLKIEGKHKKKDFEEGEKNLNERLWKERN